MHIIYSVSAGYYWLLMEVCYKLICILPAGTLLCGIDVLNDVAYPRQHQQCQAVMSAQSTIDRAAIGIYIVCHMPVYITGVSA